MKIIKIELESKSDHIKGQWWDWFATAFYENGTHKQGTVQSDGHEIAYYTFQAED